LIERKEDLFRFKWQGIISIYFKSSGVLDSNAPNGETLRIIQEFGGPNIQTKNQS